MQNENAWQILLIANYKPGETAMLVPCDTKSLPAKLCVRVISARGLPVMDKFNVTTDAFVEVHFDNEVEDFSIIFLLG